MQRRLRLCFVAAALAWLGAGCATSEQTVNTDRQEYGAKVTFSDPHEVLVQRGRQAVAEGRFDEGIATLQSVTDDPQVKSETRATAMFALGQAHANMLNPKRDVARAEALYERYLQEFPDSKDRVQVEEALRSLRATR